MKNAMQIEEYNADKIKIEDVQLFTTRVKVFILNKDKDVLIATSDTGCQLPGGHVEENEPIKESIKREVREETGIELSDEEIKEPFYEIKYIKKNYKNSGKNRLSNILYYLVFSDKKPDISKINLTEREKLNNFAIQYVNIKNFEDFVLSYANSDQKEIDKTIAEEMLRVFNLIRI